MRKKIILSTVIFVVLAAISGAVYFNAAYAMIKDIYGYSCFYERNVTYFENRHEPIGTDYYDYVLCTPSLKKFTKLKILYLAANEETDLKYLSEMNELEELDLFYFDGCAGRLETRLETLPELPKLKKITLWARQAESQYSILPYRVFELENGNYNFSNIETLSLETFEVVDFNSLKYFENLKNLYANEDSLTEKEIEELQSRGITVEIIKTEEHYG